MQLSQAVIAQQYTRLMPVERYFLLDHDEAVNRLDQAVINMPKSAVTLLRRAKFYSLLGKEQRALNDIRLAKRLNPYAMDLYGFNGPYSILQVMEVRPEKYSMSLGWDKQMVYYYSILDQKYAVEKITEVEIDRMELVIEKIELNEFNSAQLQLDTLLAQFPSSPIAYDLQGVLFTKIENFPSATQAFTKAVELEPQFAIAWYNFSRLERLKGDLAQAETYLNQSIRLQEDLSKAYFDRALLRKELGDREGALKDYNKVIDLVGESYLEAYLNRGLTRKMLGDFDGALEDMNKVIEAYPENAALYKSRADLYLLFQEDQLALDDYSHAIKLDNEYAAAFYNRGLALMRGFDRQKACEDFSKAEELGFESASEKIRFFCSKQNELSPNNY